ncbi:hypothetical protein QBC36DRAFT_336819 [Triangularia setosa]|uniref:Zn(2)-C6 fungal-type domain-containing protein n=1 Tax=Triangularia setosa TaxID=2587417 RepID=A0AAN6W133_9PEZI|nr:hypothetical protein QBC36DRAFT_336819 [Podospora setosa]
MSGSSQRPLVERKKRSCGECRRRKQKCDQKQPCGHCARRMPQPVCHYEGSPRAPRPPPLPDFNTYSFFDPGTILAPSDAFLPSPLLVGAWSQTSVAGSVGSGGSPASGEINWEPTDPFYPYPYQHEISPLAGPGDLSVYTAVNSNHTPSLIVTTDYPGPYQHEFFQSLIRNDPSTSSVIETCLSASTASLPDRNTILAARCHAVGSLHEKLGNPGSSTSDETLRSITNLVMNDLCYGEMQEIPVHIDGLKEITRLRGGLASLAGQNLGLARAVIVVDRITSLALSTTPLFPDQEISFLLPSEQDVSLALPDEDDITAILKDITFLTSTVLALPPSPSKWEIEKVASMSAWVYNRLSATNQESPLRKAVRLAALIYCRAVRERKPCHEITTAEDLGECTDAVWNVPLEVWTQNEKMLGVLVWILGAGMGREGLGFKTKVMMAAAAVEMAVKDWSGLAEVLKRVVKLQEWLRSGRDD